MKNSYLNYVNNFRGVAILFVLASHVIWPIKESNVEESLMLYSFLANLLKEGTVLFVFIAGVLFHHLSYKYKFQNYLESKVKNVLIPYIIVSVPAIIWIVFLGGTARQDFVSEYSRPFQIIYLYFSGSHLTPLWFIPMIFIFYLISPLLLRLSESKYFNTVIIVSFLISIFALKDFNNVIQCFFHYFFIYIAGMYFSKNKEKVLSLIGKFQLKIAILFIVLLAAGTFTFYLKYTPIALTLIYLNKVVLSFLIMYYLFIFDKSLNKKFDLLAQYSFGIFFIHEYIIILHFKVVDEFVDFGSLDFISSLALSIGSIIIVALISVFCLVPKKLIGRNSRYIVGC